VVRVGDAGDVGVGQLAVRAVDQAAHLAGVDEQHLAAPVARPHPGPLLSRGERRVLFVACEEPEAGGDLRRVEELTRQRDHAVH